MQEIHRGKVDGTLPMNEVLRQALASHKNFNAAIKKILSPEQYAVWEPLREADHHKIAQAHNERDKAAAAAGGATGAVASTRPPPPPRPRMENSRSVSLKSNWTNFRGTHDGVIQDTTIPSSWSRNENMAWHVDVPGYGWSSPIVWGDRVFVTTTVSEKQTAPPDRGPGGGPKELPTDTHRFEVHCIDLVSGKTLWKQIAAERVPPIATHVTNTFASETPVTDGEFVYAYFGMVGVFCYDMSGKLVWERDLGSYKMFGN